MIRIGKRKDKSEGWIKISDRLPPPYTDVILWHESCGYLGIFNRSARHGNSYKGITHWMHLPEKPE